jgi:hypothetical protein
MLVQSIKVACGPPGLDGGKNLLFHNNGDGTFTDVSGNSGILKTPGTYGLGVLVTDFDNDGWPDIYVATRRFHWGGREIPNFCIL